MADDLIQAEKFPRRTQRRLQTRERIIDAAGRLFGAVGYSGATMNAIAEAADIHVTTLFIHFKTKQDLANSLADAAIERLARLIAKAKGRTPFLDFYRDLVLEMARRLGSQQSHAVSVWNELGHDPELSFAWVQYERRQIELFAEYIAFDYSLDLTVDYRPTLVASLMLAASWAAHKRATSYPDRLDLEAETAGAISIAIQMARAVLVRSAQ
jgi:AcrR family transcriptional regulator